MFKNGFKAVFGVWLIICCFSNGYAKGEVENSKIDQVNSQQVPDENLSAQYVYYKENPWDFVENNLLIYPGACKEQMVIGDVFVFIITTMAAFMITLWMESVFEMISGNYYENKHAEVFVGIPMLSGLITGVLTTRAFHKHISTPIMRYENLISILNCYDPDLTKLGNDNMKNYIPKELHLTFDALWRIYKQQGEPNLKNEWDRVSRLIHDKIIFELKSAKYIKPVTNT
jgi:hypothetical protein